MNEQAEGNGQCARTAEEAAAFQKIWLETMSRLGQAAFTVSPNSPPPEIVRQLRSGIFQALATSWDEFMRSPQFLEGTRQWMENLIAFRKMSNDWMTNLRNQMQSPSKGDIDSIMLTIRHMEKRLLDRIEELAAEVRVLKGAAKPARRPAPSGGTRKKTRAQKSRISAIGKAGAM